MKLAIMQPYFMPYIGYWQLLNHVDTFILYDNIQYTKKGWINRNRFISSNQVTTFTIPLKKDSDFLNVNQRYVADEKVTKWKIKLLNRIKENYKKAPFFNSFYKVLEDIINTKEENLFEFNLNSIRKLCVYLDIDTEIIISSTINNDGYEGLKGENRVKALCNTLGAKTYINPIGGLTLYTKESFKDANLDLKFIQSNEGVKYYQGTDDFFNNLSIIDILMWNSVSETRIMLNDFSVI